MAVITSDCCCADIALGGENSGLGLQPGTDLISKDLSKKKKNTEN